MHALRRSSLSRKLLTLCVSACGLLYVPRFAGAEDWPQFLGPTRNGISSETGLLDAWPASGPKVVWRKAGGIGMSAVVVAKGQAITMVQKTSQSVVSLNAQSGELNWSTDIAPRYSNPQGNGPRATPAVKDGRVFAFTGEGVLAALSLSDGKIIWKNNVLKEAGGRVAEFGMACSPLVIKDRVIVTLGARGASTAAFDVQSGKQVWSSGSDPAGYSSPALLKAGGRELLAVLNGKGLLGLDPSTGKQLWGYAFPTDFDCNIATPVAYQGRVFISAGENHGSVMVKPTAGGDGSYRTEEAWTSLGVGSVLRSGWQTGIVDGRRLYSFDNVGAAGPIMHLTCIDLETGKRVWRQTRFGKGNLIAADGKLWITTMKGELVVVRINSKEYEELGRAKLFDVTRQIPALSGGRLYIRDDKEIICVDVRK